MDILIKSFNRPFYLDRCISSIYRWVEGKYNIKVLDDGTPGKYLNKIQKKYPEITIVKSENYTEKEKAIEENLHEGKEINGFKIPTRLWTQAVREASPYFIITEDDVWFTKKINVDSLEKIMTKENISLLKLGWLGNTTLSDGCTHYKINSDITAVHPNLFTAPFFIMNGFFFNKFKFFSLLYKLGLVTNETKSKYWVLNSILMGMYKKEYWLEIWKNANGKVDEKQQLLNASMYYRKHKKNRTLIAQLTTEAMKTTFISSATNSYHSYGYKFDVNRFNHIINEKWNNDEFDPLENFPKDFSERYISSFLDDAKNEKATSSEWKKWAEKFKAQYRDQGCEVDE
ncbi:MAG: glycosyltransferase [Flavobacteriaceae bacterium]|jgi:GR25 family glycosyltransferase involved in LPS biosynthesis|nr:glycosyltransferase [Flavobacteriaceae bacterium]